MGKFWAIIEIIKSLINLVGFLREKLKQKQANDERERQDNLDKAVDDSKSAQTDEEVWNAQDRINDNRG